jgi:hypothetical protein
MLYHNHNIKDLNISSNNLVDGLMLVEVNVMKSVNLYQFKLRILPLKEFYTDDKIDQL